MGAGPERTLVVAEVSSIHAMVVFPPRFYKEPQRAIIPRQRRSEWRALGAGKVVPQRNPAQQGARVLYLPRWPLETPGLPNPGTFRPVGERRDALLEKGVYFTGRCD